MSDSTNRPASAVPVDAQRIEDALSLLAPRWTTWTTQTLAQHNAPMRVREVASRLPFLNEQLVGKRLAQMHTDGLVIRANDHFHAPYQLSASAAELTPVHRALASWSQQHLALGQLPDAERVEDAVRRLSLRHATALIQLLDSRGPMRLAHVSEAVALKAPYTWQRLAFLQRDGLVTRTGPRRGDPYVLTEAGAALGPVHAAVQQWSNPLAPKDPVREPAAAATRTHDAVDLRSEGARTAAALRRTPAASAMFFSHADQPQPRVPSMVTALSAPSRTR
ncbi:winged helix-turn-helix transcriptional regulator [Streptantibioticus parmotrematis]|uniref:winged helix-turn-helix transcriptional regulator n=1 Tax=Streptantibioticus parmotrematis TaxID=2873249 RepID=UPI0033CA21C7